MVCLKTGLLKLYKIFTLNCLFYRNVIGFKQKSKAVTDESTQNIYEIIVFISSVTYDNHAWLLRKKFAL